MTVKELIEELEKIEEKSLEVVSQDYEYGENQIHNITIEEFNGIKVVKLSEFKDWD